MTRRGVLLALGAIPLGAVLPSLAQQHGKVWRVGFLSPNPVDFDLPHFRLGMRELGYVEGRNLVIERRSPGGQYERLPDLATELINLKPDVIVTASTPAAFAAQRASTTIPIVMGVAGDPVASGLVKSLARPAGNITGLTNMAAETNVKQIEMLLSMVPKLSHVAILLNPSNPANVRTSERVQAEAQKRGLKVLRAEVRTPREIDDAFSMMRQQNVGALLMVGTGEPLFQQQKSQIVELTGKLRLPSVTGDRTFSEAGVLMTYGPSTADLMRRAATHVDKIFKGAKPGDLPIEQPTKFDLVINGKTAKALGLTIPQSLLISADRVIE